ncbi:MAG: anti-sigma factor antagonist [Candidatus Omnitrophota bacterium]|jgi:anti-sigma B factor antagonist|nr:MAG: anti-sigma factor antagonist [Candidatus Omnitrophota bacterium]
MYECKKQDEKLMVAFSGRLDSLACAKIQDSLLEKIEEAKLPVVFDFKNVDYVTSAFIRICITVYKLIGKENLTCVRMNSPEVKEVFKLSRLDHYIQMDSEMDSFMHG